MELDGLQGWSSLAGGHSGTAAGRTRVEPVLADLQGPRAYAAAQVETDSVPKMILIPWSAPIRALSQTGAVNPKICLRERLAVGRSAAPCSEGSRPPPKIRAA